MNYNTKRFLVKLRKLIQDPQRRKDILAAGAMGAVGTGGSLYAYDAVHGPKGEMFDPGPEYQKSITPTEEPKTSNLSNEDLYATLLTGGLGAALGSLMASENRGTGAFVGGLAGGSLPLLYRLYQNKTNVS